MIEYGRSDTDLKMPGILVGDRDFPLLFSTPFTEVGTPCNNSNHHTQLQPSSCVFEHAVAGHFMTPISSRVLPKIPTSLWMTMLSFIQTP